MGSLGRPRRRAGVVDVLRIAGRNFISVFAIHEFGHKLCRT